MKPLTATARVTVVIISNKLNYALISRYEGNSNDFEHYNVMESDK